jgi:hypothetical protein
VDILGEYGLRKRLESLYKKSMYTIEGKDPRSVSVIEPEAYANRLLLFIDKHTV